jgi:predicted anti-sigma-YlaC factor YlaD
MNCLDCETLILDHAELDPAAVAISAHLTDCGKCREFLATQRALHNMLRQGLGTIRLPAEFQSRLRGRIRRDQSLNRLHRAIAFTEFASLPLLVVAVFLVSAGLMRLPWLDPRLYVPAIAASIVLLIVKDVASGENAAD